MINQMHETFTAYGSYFPVEVYTFLYAVSDMKRLSQRMISYCNKLP